MQGGIALAVHPLWRSAALKGTPRASRSDPRRSLEALDRENAVAGSAITGKPDTHR